MPRALVPAHFLNQLAAGASALGVDLTSYDKQGVPSQGADGAEILFRWWLSPEQGDRLIREFPLRWIHSGSAGVDHILTPAFSAASITLTNSSGVHAPSIAEWVVAAMLGANKDLARMIDQQRSRVWEKVERPEMAGQRVLFFGAGHIAREIAARLRPFGMLLTAYRSRPSEDPAFDRCVTEEVAAHSDVPRGDREVSNGVLLREASQADWLIVTVPLTDSTRGAISREVLAALPRTARLINVARGEIIDQAALIESLASARLAGAILDVFDEEPLSPASPLWSLPGVLVLPHTTWRSPEVHQREVALFLDNLGRYRDRRPLRNVVDVNRGY